MRAVGNHIIFEYFEVKERASGFVMPEAIDSQSSSIIGKVVSVGSGVHAVKVGDNIIIPKLMRTPIDKDLGLYSTQENQVFAIID